MRCLEIEEAIFRGAIYNKATIWPDGFNPEDFGCILL